MTAKYTISYPTGLFIPVEKQPLFIVSFEDMLVSAHNVVPLFGPATRKNTCEVKFNYLGNKSYKPESFVSDVEKALEFLRTNMSILGPRKFSKRKRKSNRFQTTPQIITVDDESEVRTVDLTDGDHGDPEIIVLEDSIVHSGRQTRQSSTSSSVVDLTDISVPSKTPAKRKETESDIQILHFKTFIPQTSSLKSTPSNEIQILNMCTPKNSKKRKKRGKTNRKPVKRTTSNSIKSGSLTSLSSADSLPRKKRKLQDISNIHSVASGSTSPVQPSSLSENAMKYYENISKVVGKAAGEKKESSTGNGPHMPVRNHIDDYIKRKNKSLTKKMSPIRVFLEANKKRKIVTPQNSFKHKDTWNPQRRFFQKSLAVHNYPGRLTRTTSQKGFSNHVRKIGETNSFNPNPFEVDLEGLRPIVIDGCNVAIGHGKGRFSPMGLKICVDYFAARGHTKIKVFLPQFRQEEFSAELLETLKTKCDVVFTPSQCINGQRRTPYDDRFIVQYATEFGGVIVSTDNYRDLSRENPRWQDTIAKRLLMFTWVDDFLMFPVDPLGRTGPTLEEFLRF